MQVNKNDLVGRRVFVYYNLHKHTWSIKDWKTKRVIAHLDTVVLTDCQYKVSEKGRQRVIKEKRKNVHAGILGTIIGTYEINDLDEFIPITYNPYKFDSFVTKHGHIPMRESEGIVYMHKRQVFERSMLATLKEAV